MTNQEQQKRDADDDRRRRAQAHQIRDQLYQGFPDNAKNSPVVMQMIDLYHHGHWDRKIFEQQLVLFRERFKRQHQAFEFFLQRLCQKHGLPVTQASKQKLFGQVINNFQDIIIRFGQEFALTNNDLETCYKQFDKMSRRHEVVDQLCRQMACHPDFQNLPAPYHIYFGKYLVNYLNDPELSFPRLMYIMEEKHKLILDSLKRSGRLKQIKAK